MSVFSQVDELVESPGRLLRFLDHAADAEAGMKHYVMAAHAMRVPRGPILDVGSGAGHDLVLLGSVGLRPVGVDPSAVMVSAAAARTASLQAGLARGTGELLPFRDGAFSGCRIERVLMHVEAPEVVLAEAVRCLEPGGLITVFEPDWDSFRVTSEIFDETATWLTGVRHPGIGGLLWTLLERVGCEVLDRVEERSVWRSLDVLDRIVRLAPAVERAVKKGAISRADGARWVTEQRNREARGTFLAVMPKVLVVAKKPPRTEQHRESSGASQRR